MRKQSEKWNIRFCELIPKILLKETFYITKTYGGISYLCPCDCGEEVWIPTGNTKSEWELDIIESKVFIKPSVSHRGHCKSHYFIKGSKIVWVED